MGNFYCYHPLNAYIALHNYLRVLSNGQMIYIIPVSGNLQIDLNIVSNLTVN